MKIQFVLPALHMTGGVRVVCEHARRLADAGNEITLLAPPPRMPLGPRERLQLGAWKHYAYERWSGRIQDGLRAYGLENAVRPIRPGSPESAPAADVTVATAWMTAEWVAGMPASVGRKYYLIQQYEAWTEDIRPRVDATWKMPLRKIVIAHWLERLARDRFEESVVGVIPNGVDARWFAPPDRRPGGGVTVGLFYDLLPWKGAEDGLAALWKIHRAQPATRFLLLGRPRLRHAVPPGTRYFRDPPQVELPRAYQAADIFLSPSHSEGFSLVTLEAMACGCALVATAVGQVPEMGAPGKDYLMVESGDPAALADAALQLVVDPGWRRAVAEAGLALARSYSWDRATQAFMDCLARPD